MELNNPGLDKMMEALAPELSEDLARILDTARGQLEEEFRKHLQAMLREMEAAFGHLMQQQQEETLAKLRDELTANFQSQFDETVQKTNADMQAEFEQRMQASEGEWKAEKEQLQEQLNLWRTYAEAQREMAESRSQVDVLSHFLDRVGSFAPSVALYVSKADGLALWKTRGTGAFPPIVSQNTIDPEAYFRPIVVRDKTVAAVCAHPPFKPEPLDFLSACLAHAIETFGMRLQHALAAGA